jgi:hypothetical protein
LNDAEKDETLCDADENKITRNEAPIPTGRLRDLLNHLNITTHPEFKIKRVPRPRWEEYNAIMEIFSLMCSAVTRVQLSEPRTRMQ